MLEKIEDAIMGVTDSVSSHIELVTALFEAIHEAAFPDIRRVVDETTRAKNFSRYLRKKGKDFSNRRFNKYFKIT